MSHDSKYTSDHDEIRNWVEAHGGQPATIADTARGKEKAGLLRIDLPGGAGNPPLEPISWEAFFDKFDKENLVFLYQDETAEGKERHFCKFVDRETVMQRVGHGDDS